MPYDAYGKTARWYDAFTGSALRPVRGCLAAWMAETPGRVLDIGCGTGVFVAALVRQGLDAVGTDISPAMLTEARKRLAPERAVAASGLPLPFSSGSFDAAALCLVMHESEDGPDALLAEAFRIAPRCYVAEWRMPERNLDFLALPLVHWIERAAGKRHYENFRRFARAGYLHGAAARLGARVVREAAFRAGTLVAAEVVR